jgi:unsaturated rhamnogalacturonyl hydrolase
MLQSPDPAEKPLWWWCDALFMAPPVLAKLSRSTGDAKYLEYMDRQWGITSASLYHPKEHLFFRDATYLDKHEKNGRPLFWSRGNGWVMAGLVRVLQAMPAGDPARPKYVAQFKEMAAALAAVQGKDGLWRPGLLDPGAYPLPEISGSAFITYAYAYGVNEGILDRSEYLPRVKKAWAGLLSHIYADGRLGAIQPIGGAPGEYTARSSYVYGVGAFLMAGSEIYRLARN